MCEDYQRENRRRSCSLNEKLTTSSNNTLPGNYQHKTLKATIGELHRIQRKLSTQDLVGFKENYKLGDFVEFKGDYKPELHGIRRNLPTPNFVGFKEDYQRGISWDLKKTTIAGFRGIQRRPSTRDFVGFKKDHQRGTSWDLKKT
ncbi:unnamed protein product [Xylocopa violacea]|uniref:Uncharacterized protein n=1 Tax=Xylocopa violacea TaxID=135666 RepID=A0ABP1PA95_XYLVO